MYMYNYSTLLLTFWGVTLLILPAVFRLIFVGVKSREQIQVTSLSLYVQASSLPDTHSLHVTLSTYQKYTWGDLLMKVL